MPYEIIDDKLLVKLLAICVFLIVSNLLAVFSLIWLYNKYSMFFKISKRRTAITIKYPLS